MIEVAADIEVPCTPAEAFAVLADMARNPEWQRGMVSSEWTSHPPVGVGSISAQTARFAGRDIVTTFEVTEYDPPHLIRIVSVESTFPLDITRTVTATAVGCRITARILGEPGGLLRWLSPLTRRMAQRSVNADYARLYALLSR